MRFVKDYSLIMWVITSHNAGKKSIVPAKAAATIVEAVEGTDLAKNGGVEWGSMNVPLGRQFGLALTQRVQLLKAARDMTSLWSSVDFPEAK